MSTQITDLKDSIKAEVAAELGANYKELAYLEVIEKNSFRTGSERYGVRSLEASEQSGVTGVYTMKQAFEVVISKGYIQSSIDDTEQVTKSYEIRESFLDIYKRLVNNKAGIPSVVMLVTNLVISEPEYLEDDKLTLVRMQFEIIYRITL